MKKILMLLAFAGVASVASAQQTVTVTAVSYTHLDVYKRQANISPLTNYPSLLWSVQRAVRPQRQDCIGGGRW